MQPIGEGDRSFTMSLEELQRREGAFDRLGVSLILTFVVGAVDLLASHALAVTGIAACLAALFIASRRWLSAGNRRYAQTRWVIGRSKLTRTDLRSTREFPLSSLRRVQAKRSTAGVIREIKLTFDDGTAVYPNGLADAESFWECLSSSGTGAAQAVLREPIDYDHPLFYIALGGVLGASLSVIVRIGASAPQFDGHWVYVALAAYSLAVSAYWLRAKPVSGRYGVRALALDHAVAAAAFVCFVGAAIAAAVL